MNWLKRLRGKVKFNEPLADHTTFKIGGPCEYFIEPSGTPDLKDLIKRLKKDKIPFLILGCGSNVLVSDRGVKGTVIHLSSPAFKKIVFKGNFCDVGAGAYLPRVVSVTAAKGLSGCEFLSGIPATLGGALIMNAGQGKGFRSIGDLTEQVTVMNYNGNIRVLRKKDIRFNYRKSSLGKYIILGARLKLERKEKKEIRKSIREFMKRRMSGQEMQLPSAGCVFKNPPADYAGRLIDACGLKGKRVGGACVSHKHANFIVNTGKANANEVIKLIQLIRNRVMKKFDVSLDAELRIWR